MVFERLAASPRATLLPVPFPGGPGSDDFQILLWALQQMAYRSFDGVDLAWEQEPTLRSLRDRLEVEFEADLRGAVALGDPVAPEAVADGVRRLIAAADGPSLSAWMYEHGELSHLREFAVHRAAYQLQEADPHSFAIPRLVPGRAKRALLQIQLDEYGEAKPHQSHAELFAQTLDVLGVHRDIDLLPVATLRTNTALNLFAGSRRLLGACVGHLAVFEMCSVEPMSRYAATVRRLLPDAAATRAARFFDVHVFADAWHEQLAITDLVGGFVEQFPTEANEVLFGAAALLHVENEFAAALLSCWQAGRSSLRVPAATASHRRIA